MRGIGLVASAAIAAVVGPGLAAVRPWVIWNTTASAPIGVYRLSAAARPQTGDLVAVRPPAPLAAWLARTGYAPAGVLLVKRVAAIAPAVVCRTGNTVLVEGRPAGLALARGRLGEWLPTWRGCVRLRPGELFLLNRARRSLDSRYFGPLPAASVVGRLTPLWLKDSP